MKAVSRYPRCVVLILSFFSFFVGLPALAVEVSIANTEVRELYSQKVQQNYRLLINLPYGYEQGEQHYPVIYLLDAQWDFPLISATYGQMYYDGFVPAAIVVGITWGGEGDNPDELRVRDFTPSKMAGEPLSGGAKAFLDFIQSELFPFMAHEYKAGDERVLMGSSLGGLFTLYSLFERPEMFSAYIPTASASGWDNGVVYTFAQKNQTKLNDYFAKHPTKVYSAVGDLDSLKPAFMQLQDFFKQQPYRSTLMLNIEVLGKLGHAGVKAAGNAWGLQYVFDRGDSPLSAEQLQAWLGSYRHTLSGEIIEIGMHNQHLTIAFADNTPIILKSLNPSQFYQEGEFRKLRFSRDANNKPNLNIAGFAQQDDYIQIKSSD
ncbi:MAG: alpha/beta hydrolase [Paraglaciecola sp.]|nr:alpha/beta hydrolase [Paraglaciecola sp.]NCT47634.1 alpha/beta hydrolase [Paraglaciecola sp.]